MPSQSENPEPDWRTDFRFDLSGTSARTYRAGYEQDLAELAPEPSLERVRLLTRIVSTQTIDEPDAAARGARAVSAMAADLQEPAAAAYALVAQGLTDHSPSSARTRLAGAHRILATARDGHAPELATVGHYLLLTALLAHGDIRDIDLELSPRGLNASTFPHLLSSRHAQWFRCLRAILDGRTAVAEVLAGRLLASAAPDDELASRSVWAAQIGTVRWMQGRVMELEPAFLSARQEHPTELLWEYSLVWLWQMQGRATAARALLADFPDPAVIPKDANRLVTLTILGEIASRGGENAQAELMRDALLPYARQAVQVGLGLGFWGTVARTLGMLCRALGRYDEARAHFLTAIDVCARSGAQAWLVEAQLELAEHEIATDGDLGHAAALVAEALTAAESLDFPGLAERARATREKLPTGLASTEADIDHDDTIVSVPPPRARVHVLGAFEVTAHTGVSAEWRSRKARDLLKMLIARRGVATNREVFMQALWPDIRPTALANRFTVALSTVRRAFDPGRALPVQHFVVLDGQSLHLDLDSVWVDAEDFLSCARNAEIDELRRAVRLYAGEAFADEPYAEWASALRDEAQTAFCAAARKLGAWEAADGGHLAASELYRRVLEIEPFDRDAHEGLLAALTALGAHSQARAAARRLNELQLDLQR